MRFRNLSQAKIHYGVSVLGLAVMSIKKTMGLGGVPDDFTLEDAQWAEECITPTTLLSATLLILHGKTTGHAD